MQPSLDFAEFGHASRSHPFGDHDVALVIETGIVRVNKLARPPFSRGAAHLETSQGLFPPLRVVSQLSHNLV